MKHDELMHYGIRGQKWGIRRFQNPDGTLTPEGRERYSKSTRSYELSKKMSSFKYSDFTTLMSHDEVAIKKRGSCHDQVMYELEELRKLGYSPKADFFMDVDKSGQGYQTHSFAHYDDERGNHIWFENAWEDQKGIHVYKNESEMYKDIRRKHKTPKGIDTIWGTFDDSKLRPGMDLQDVVDTCLE